MDELNSDLKDDIHEVSWNAVTNSIYSVISKTTVILYTSLILLALKRNYKI